MQNFQPPLVSILINNYNYGRFLNEAIDSALNQTYSNIEVIVVDDGSTDNSQEIIDSYQDRIVPIIKQNGGQASAFNTGFSASKGEIICFLDADDIFLPEKVAEIVNIFVSNEEVGWCIHILRFFGANQEDTANFQDISLSGIYDLRDKIKSGKLGGIIPGVKLNLATSAMCFRRCLIEKIVPMPEAIRITSDDYIKYIAFGLSPCFILVKELTLQRIHVNNAYTLRKDNNKKKLAAKIMILTAYWMTNNFPDVMSRFSNNIFAIGISLYWLNGGIEEESKYLVNNYLASLSLMEKITVYTRVYFYYLKVRYQAKYKVKN
jgi:glycosyltransferase involved in cell wall biosynthesis